MREFKDRLRAAMAVSGINSAELARRCELAESNVSHFLTGQRKPGIDNLAKLLAALPSVDARWLVCG